MTNREWLESLSDEDLALWLCNAYFVEETHILYPEIKVRYCTGLDDIRKSTTDSLIRMKEWVKEEHK